MRTLCLVPTPLRAARAARRLCDAQGGLLFGPGVLTPDGLAAAVLAEAGERRPALGPLAARLLAAEAGRAAGGLPAEVAPASGLGRALEAALRELRAGEVGAAALADAARSLGGAARARLETLAAALGAFEERLGELGALDRAAAARAAARVLRRGGGPPALRSLDLLVLEGPHRPGPAEWDLLAAAADRAGRVLARVPFLPERPDLCGPAEPFLRRIEALGAEAGREVAVSFPDAGERAPRLARVLAAVRGGAAAGPLPEGGRVVGLTGPGEEGEAEAAAGLAADLAAGGLDPADIALVAPAPARSAPLLARAFRETGVPLSTGQGGPLAGAPPVRAIREALGAAAAGIGRRAAEALLRSSYLRLARCPPGLDAWLDRAGAVEGRGDPEALLRSRAARLRPGAEREGCEAAAAALREAREALRPLAAPGTAREMARTLRAFVFRSGARRRAARAEPDVAARDLAALSRLEEAADDLAGALGLLGRAAERLEPGAWLSLLDVALDGAALPPAPEPGAGAAELWPLSEAPGLGARAAIVLGCTPGAFPPPHPAEPLLRDPERSAVNRHLRRAALESGGARRARGPFLAFSAMAAAGECLALAWPSGEPGGGPSPLALEALEAGGAAPPEAAPAPLGRARTAAQALRASARLGREGLGEAACAALAAADPGLAARAASALGRGRMEQERREDVRARRAGRFSGGVPRELLAALGRALPGEWTPSQLETWAVCPFQLFTGLALGIPEREAADLDIDPRDEGSLLHAVLERFVAARRDRGAWPPAGSPEDGAEARAIAARLFASFEAEGRVGDPALWPARREALLARLDLAVQAEAAAADGMRPVLLEHRFGGPSGFAPLELEDGGERVLLRGRVDRVDADAERLLVIDYKNVRDRRAAAARLDPQAQGVSSFQVPAYLLAAARALPGRRRLLATCQLLRTGERLAPLAAEAVEGLVAPREAGRGKAASRPTFAAAVVSAVRGMRAGAFPVASRDCDGCRRGAVCRFPGAAEGWA